MCSPGSPTARHQLFLMYFVKSGHELENQESDLKASVKSKTLEVASEEGKKNHRKLTQASKAAGKGSGDKIQHKFTKKYTNIS